MILYDIYDRLLLLLNYFDIFNKLIKLNKI